MMSSSSELVSIRSAPRSSILRTSLSVSGLRIGTFRRPIRASSDRALLKWPGSPLRRFLGEDLCGELYVGVSADVVVGESSTMGECGVACGCDEDCAGDTSNSTLLEVAAGRWLGRAFRGPFGSACRPLTVLGVGWLCAWAWGPGEPAGEKECLRFAELLGLLRNMSASAVSFSLVS